MMHMTFYWSQEVTLLVNSWHTKSWLAYALSLLACVLASAFYQYMENRRLRFKIIAAAAASLDKSSPALQIDQPLLQPRATGAKWSAARLAGAVLFGVNSAIGYLLMLAVMSFNGGVFLAVVLGMAIGYLFFRSEDENFMLVDNPCACA